MVLLYLDLLGMKGRWRSGGVPRARATYSALSNLVHSALATLPPATAVSGGLQSDAIAFVLPSPVEAIQVGRSIYRDAFLLAQGPQDDRFWLRGVIVSLPDPAPGLTSTATVPGFPGVSEVTYSDELLHAINSEQAGFKGARLLIESDLVTPVVRNAVAVPVGTERCHPCCRLRFVQGLSGFRDVLWMIPDVLPDWDTWDQREDRMRRLARWAAGTNNLEELLHVGATAIIFAECRAILQRLGRTGGLPHVP